MKKILAPLLFLIAFVNAGKAQFNIDTTDFIQGVNPLDCSVYFDGSTPNFYDAGGTGAFYENNSSDTLTVCPDLALGSKVTAAFGVNSGFTWSVDSTDTLFVFDGADVNAPLVGAYNSNTDPNGFNVQATFENNPSGCLTFVFLADAADSASGWDGNITCGNPYQPFYPHMQAFKNGDPADTLAPADTGYINVCLGDSILFVANPDFAFSSDITGTGYSQNMNNVTVEWEFSDGSTLTGDSVWFTPPMRQGYLVTLKVTDAFPSVEYLMAKIRVSTLPTFSGVLVQDDSICIGDTTFIVGGVTFTDTVGVDPTETSFQLGGTYAGVTYLPDGSGVNYSTSIPITGFTPGDTVSALSDIENVCITMEHSYLGDLEMWLECPDGTTVTIFNANGGGSIPGGFGGGSTYLGDALDNSIGSPGTGWEYCFSSANATWGTMATEYGNGNTVPTTISSGSAMNPNGTYLPEQTFADLIGCPINGDWTIYVRDNLSVDDGYIFEWGIFFDPLINPNNESYAPVIVNDYWTSTSPNIVSGGSGADSTATVDTVITVVGQIQGTDLFTYVVEDDFGCFYDTTVSLVVAPQPTITMNITGNPTTCPGDSVLISTQGSTAIPPYTYSWSNGVVQQTNQLWVNPVTDSLFIVTLTDWCNTPHIDTAAITVPISLMNTFPGLDTLYCPSFSMSVTMGVTGGGTPYTYLWSNGQTTATLTDNPAQTTGYQITVSDQCGQIAQTSDTIYVIYTPLIDSALVYTSQCPGDAHTLLSYVEGGVSNYSYAWSSGQTTNSISVNPNSTTVYVVSVTDQCNQIIIASDTIFVPIYDPLQAITLQSGEVICPADGRRFTIDAEDGSMFGYVYQWSHDALETDSFTIVNITQDTTVFATITDGCGESTTATFYGVLPVYNDVSVVVTPESFLICEGDTVESTGIVSGGAGIYTYEWIGNNVLGAYDEISASLHPSDELGFNLIATDQCGNDDTTTVYIEFDDCSVVAPAVFSPNGDAYNQYLHFINLEKWPNNHLLVYNRWGTKVYDNNYENDWDGDNQPDGVYYYILTLSDREEPMSGYFHITR